MKLGGEPREGYTIRDESWYDPATHRFAHVLSLEGRPLFANSYDGRSVHLLELDEQGQRPDQGRAGRPRIPAAEGPAEFLGMFALREAGAKDESRPDTTWSATRVRPSSRTGRRLTSCG